MANEELFSKLADALSQPSKTFRAVEEGFRGVRNTGQELRDFADRREEERKRRIQQKTLRDVLGVVPERFAGVADIPAEQVSAFGDLSKLADPSVLSDRQPTSLEAVLARDVAAGKRTFEDAAKAKRSLSLEPRPVEKKLTPGQQTGDRVFAVKWNQYAAQGGREASEQQLDRVSKAAERLEELNPGRLARAGSIAPDALRGFIQPKYKAIEQDARSAVTALLRKTLGAQFTEKEGERIFSQTFDPTLRPEQNSERLRDLERVLRGEINSLEEAGNYFDEFGTLTGFRSQPSGEGIQNPASTPIQGGDPLGIL